jgi:hypothetical protein
MTSSKTELFDTVPFARGLTLRNRVVMAPMTTWSGNEDGTVSAEEEDYYRRRVNGVGLVITGCTHVTPNGIGFTGEFAAYDDRFIPSLAAGDRGQERRGARDPADLPRREQGRARACPWWRRRQRQRGHHSRRTLQPPAITPGP